MAAPTQSTVAAIATLTVLVEGIDKRMIEDRNTAERDREETRAVRNALQSNQHATQTELQTIREHAASMDARLAKVEPVTDMVTGWKFMAAGALGLIGIFGGAMIGLLKFMGISFGQQP